MIKMLNIRRYLKSITLLFAGLLGACNLDGVNMEASNFFQPEMVALLQEIQSGNKNRAEEKISDGVSLNVHGKEGITPLFWLIINKDKPAMKLALQLGADPNFPDPIGDTPIGMVAGGNDDGLC